VHPSESVILDSASVRHRVLLAYLQAEVVEIGSVGMVVWSLRFVSFGFDRGAFLPLGNDRSRLPAALVMGSARSHHLDFSAAFPLRPLELEDRTADR
jgi:hypothetical protein